MKFKDKFGFTLIELLLALSLATIIGGAIYGTLRAGLDSTKKGNYISEKNQLARALFEQIRDDLMTASVSSTNPNWVFEYFPNPTSNGRLDSIRFVSTNQEIDWDRSGIANSAYIQYSIDTIVNTGQVGLVRIINRQITEPDSIYLEYQFISAEIRNLEFQFYNGLEWLDEWITPTILPKAVRIRMAVADLENPELWHWYNGIIRIPQG